MRNSYLQIVVILIGVVSFTLVNPQFTLAQKSANPPMEGFDLEGSDKSAIEIADRVMQELGGRKNWDNTRYVTWKFFGRRMHVWDKWTGDIRVEAGDRVTLMNIHSRKGKVWEKSVEITNPDSLAKRLDQGMSAWINDSYWVFMPYKLKDSGVTLTYNGEGKTEDGREAHMLQLTFKNVGKTPQNKYDVCVDKETYMVTQWSYYRDASDKEPRFTMPWKNWQKMDNIMLSDDRGGRKHSDIAVFAKLPKSVFESPNPVDMMSFIKEGE